MNVPSQAHGEAHIRPREQPTGADPSAMKPRKVNTEVRKQQNRMASRNYREKRKRKLQQLQQLLEDDDPAESQTHTRSASPYEDGSFSGSVGYERSVASSSPHIAAVTGAFEPPRPDETTTVEPTWEAAVHSTGHLFTYNHPQFATYQQSTAHSMATHDTSSYPVWSTVPSNISTGYIKPGPEHQTIYSSHASMWPPSGPSNHYLNAVNQLGAAPNPIPYTPFWQPHTDDEFPKGIAVDPYGRRYYTYNPS